MNVGEVDENVPFTFTCAGLNDDSESRKISHAMLLGQRRDGQPLILSIADTLTTDIDDATDNFVTWEDADDGATNYPPSGTATKRNVEPGETGRTTFTATISGKRGLPLLPHPLHLRANSQAVAVRSLRTSHSRLVS